MSNIISSLVQQKRTGSAVKKSVLSYMADKSADDGSGIWTSKANMARDLELSRRAVQKAISDLEADGLIREVGKRSCGNGFTCEYQIMVYAVHKLQSTREIDAQDDGERTRERGSHVNEVHVTCAPGSHQDVNHVHPNHPLTILEPSIGASVGDDLFSEEETPKVDPVEDTLSRFYEIFPKRHNRQYSTPAKIRKPLKAALKKIPADDLLRAVAHYCASPDHKNGQYAMTAVNWLNGEEWQKYLGNPTEAEEEMTPMRRKRLEIEARNEALRQQIEAERRAEGWG